MSAALTRREQAVKRTLLNELKRMNKAQGAVGLSYIEKKRLEEHLDADFITQELARIHRRRRWLWTIGSIVLGLMVTVAGLNLVLLGTGEAFDATDHVFNPLMAAGYVFFFVWMLRTLRRKRFIYEALRDLSDAEEADVKLSKAIEEADALIERIVARELEAGQSREPKKRVKA